HGQERAPGQLQGCNRQRNDQNGASNPPVILSCTHDPALQGRALREGAITVASRLSSAACEEECRICTGPPCRAVSDFTPSRSVWGACRVGVTVISDLIDPGSPQRRPCHDTTVRGGPGASRDQNADGLGSCRGHQASEVGVGGFEPPTF